MALEQSVSFDGASRGIALTVHGGATPRLDISLKTQEQDIVLSTQVQIEPRDLPVLAELAEVMAHPGARALDVQRLRFQNWVKRADLALSPVARALRIAVHWLLSSREDTNYTFDITPRNKLYLAHLLSLVTGRPRTEIAGYFAELESDDAIRSHIAAVVNGQEAAAQAATDPVPLYGRRLGWYAMARILRPRLVIETGLDKGLGSVVLCAALLRNAAEGAPGRYLGTDIRPEAGAYLAGIYRSVGEIAVGDSLATLRTLNEPIDLFINDSAHAAEYEYAEYETVDRHVGTRGVILGDNSHSTDRLAVFAEKTGRRFVFFREEAQDHFYPGAGIGIAFT